MHSSVERNKLILTKYIPEPAISIVADWIYLFDFKLKIKKSRSTKLGDYRPPLKGLNHQISINQDLNKYSFLITLVHEIAHLTNWNKHKHSVKPHGEEWKMEYKKLIRPFLTESIFPNDVILAIERYMYNPAASSCSDLNLQRTLKKYDTTTNKLILEQLEINSRFIYKKNSYIKGKMLRKRYECVQIETRRKYLFNPLCEIEKS